MKRTWTALFLLSILSNNQALAADDLLPALSMYPKISSYLAGSFDSVLDLDFDEIDITVGNRMRGSLMPVHLYVPHSIGTAPVLILSHGLLDGPTTMSYLAQYLAKKGYLVIAPVHQGSSLLDALTALSNVKNPSYWKLRAFDISAIVDQLPLIETRIQNILGIKFYIDKQKVAMVGHSFGAYTTLCVAGVRQKMPSGFQTFGDERIKAFIAISPTGIGAYGFTNDQEDFLTIKRPLFVVTGTEDTNFQGVDQTYYGRLAAFFYSSNSTNRIASVFNGARHINFAYPGPFSPIRARLPHLAYLFLQANLYGNLRAEGIIKTETTFSGIDFDLYRAQKP